MKEKKNKKVINVDIVMRNKSDIMLGIIRFVFGEEFEFVVLIFKVVNVVVIFVSEIKVVGFVVLEGYVNVRNGVERSEVVNGLCVIRFLESDLLFIYF